MQVDKIKPVVIRLLMASSIARFGWTGDSQFAAAFAILPHTAQSKVNASDYRLSCGLGVK
jgi:hypothetical protein